jgi:hypothetical protein
MPENPAFRRLFTPQFMPGATKEQADWFKTFEYHLSWARGRRGT